MASHFQQKNYQFPCLMCLETRALKIVGNCNHKFCIECLFSILRGHNDVFPCPSCQANCPRPLDGVKGLVDFTGDDGNLTKDNDETSACKTTEEQDQSEISCDICDHNNNQAKAVNRCHECDNLNICKDCSRRHNKSKATGVHILTPIVSKTKVSKSMCKVHHKLLISFCQTCGVPACNICVCIDHEDHDVERLADVIRSKIEGVKVILETRQNKLKELQQLEKELTVLKVMVPMVDREDILINEIEDHAKKCMDEIGKWKEDLKAQVKLDYKIRRDISADLEQVTETVQKLQDVALRAESLLPETEHNPEYLHKLGSLQKELEDIPGAGAEVEERQHRRILQKVYREDNTFRAEQIHVNFGGLDKSEEDENSGYNFKIENIFETDVPADSPDSSIPCIAAMGDRSYAVANPTREREPAKAISIYEFPGTLTKTLTDNVPPFRDMTATPDGKLVLLSHEEDYTRGCLSVFDPVTCKVSSIYDIPTAKTLSFGVTLEHRYVILGEDDQGHKHIIVLDKNGYEQYRHEIDEKQFWYLSADSDDRPSGIIEEIDDFAGEEEPRTAEGQLDSDSSEDENTAKHYVAPVMIACGGRFIFIQGGQNVAIYEMDDTGVHRITTINKDSISAVTAIKASIWDDIILADIDAGGLYLSRLSKTENEVDWEDLKYECILEKPSESEKISTVSTIGGNVLLMSHGLTIKVFQVE